MAAATLFAIDTASMQCSLALAYCGELDVIHGEPGQTHLEHVLPMIQRLFARHAMGPAQCAAFAFGSGPGSFTGLRVACTIVQGLALGCARPVIAVGNLTALATKAAEAGEGGPQRALVALDARMAQAYVAVLEGSASQWQARVSPSLIDAADLAGLAAAWQPDFCAGDVAWMQACLAQHRERDQGGGAESMPWQLRDAAVDAGVIAQLAALKLTRGEVLDPAQAVPDYVRNDVAKTVAQRRAALLAGAA